MTISQAQSGNSSSAAAQDLSGALFGHFGEKFHAAAYRLVRGGVRDAEVGVFFAENASRDYKQAAFDGPNRALNQFQENTVNDLRTFVPETKAFLEEMEGEK